MNTDLGRRENLANLVDIRERRGMALRVLPTRPRKLLDEKRWTWEQFLKECLRLWREKNQKEETQ